MHSLTCKHVNLLFLVFVLINWIIQIQGQDSSDSIVNESGVEMKENYQSPKAGGEDQIRLVTMLGDQSKYKLGLDAYDENNNYLSLTCDEEKVVTGNFNPANPCSTSTKEHKQILSVFCTLHPESGATVTFYRDGTNKHNHTASVLTTGKNIKVGFTSDPLGKKHKALGRSPSPTKPMYTNKVHSSVIFDCIGSS